MQQKKECLMFESMIDALLVSTSKKYNVVNINKVLHNEEEPDIELKWDVSFKDSYSQEAFEKEMQGILNKRCLSNLVFLNSLEENSCYYSVFYLDWCNTDEDILNKMNDLVSNNKDIKLDSNILEEEGNKYTFGERKVYC